MNLTPENVAKIEAALEIAARFVNRGSNSDCIASARRAMAETKERDATPAQIEQARAEHGSDEIEIDDCASTSPAPDSCGTWVAAWVWLADPADCPTAQPDLAAALADLFERGSWHDDGSFVYWPDDSEPDNEGAIFTLSDIHNRHTS